MLQLWVGLSMYMYEYPAISQTWKAVLPIWTMYAQVSHFQGMRLVVHVHVSNKTLFMDVCMV